MSRLNKEVMVDIPSSKFQTDIYEALKTWHKANPEASPLAHLQLFREAGLEQAGNAREITNRLLFKAIAALEVEHELEAKLLRKRFLDGLAMHVVANQLNMSEANAYRKQKEAIEQLARLLQAEEMAVRGKRWRALEARSELPAPTDLIGVDTPLRHVGEALTAPQPPWLVCIDGLGGIGKTALANALLRQPGILDCFVDIAWVSAKQQHFLPATGLAHIPAPVLQVDTLADLLLEQLGGNVSPALSPAQKMIALTELLKQAPYLVVIDNLETAVDYQALLPTLHKLAQPSKFLLTTRHSLRAHSDVFSLSLPELSPADTIRLLRHEAEGRGLAEVSRAPEAQLKSIHSVVGGNPLALKLVVGQMAVLSLPQVLDNLQQARGKTIDELYTFIYWQAWHMLPPAGQKALLMMPLAQDGALAQLAAVTQLDPVELGQALPRLVELSLLQVGGTLAERRYTIHRLTETFLLNEAIKWTPSA